MVSPKPIIVPRLLCWWCVWCIGGSVVSGLCGKLVGGSGAVMNKASSSSALFAGGAAADASDDVAVAGAEAASCDAGVGAGTKAAAISDGGLLNAGSTAKSAPSVV